MSASPISELGQQILSFSRQLDQIQWNLDDQLADHPISTEFLSEIKQRVWVCFSQYLAVVYPNIQLGKRIFEDNLHFLEKHERLTVKIMQLVPVEPVLTHQQFVERSHFKPQSSCAPLAEISRSIEPVESASLLLSQISNLLRQGNDSEALRVFNESLPLSLQKNVFDALWIIRGQPSPSDPIGHENFGEISFKNREPRCASTPQQKACAIEWVKLSSVFLDLITVVKKNDLALLRREFEVLPVHIQNEIFKKHWEQMDCPTSNSPRDTLRKIAHPDFGKVSFLGLVPRCDVFAAYKVKTLEAYVVDFNQKITIAQTSTERIKVGWDKMGLDPELCAKEQTSIKKNNLHHFAKEIVPLFEGPTALKIDAIKDVSGGSHHLLGESYVGIHSCLRPFFLQLMNNLNL